MKFCLLKYQNIIKSLLQDHADYRANLPDGYTSQVLFDDEQGQYLVLDIGWSGDKLHEYLSRNSDKTWDGGSLIAVLRLISSNRWFNSVSHAVSRLSSISSSKE